MEAEGKAEVTVGKTRWLLSKLSSSLGSRPIAEVTPHELLAVLRTSEKAGQRETARRLRSFASRVANSSFRLSRSSRSDLVDPLLTVADPNKLTGPFREGRKSMLVVGR